MGKRWPHSDMIPRAKRAIHTMQLALIEMRERRGEVITPEVLRDIDKCLCTPRQLAEKLWERDRKRGNLKDVNNE